MANTEQADILIEQPDFCTDQPSPPAEKLDPLTQKSRWSNWGVLTVIVLCFFLIICFGPSDRPHVQQQAGIGKRLPQLELWPLSGGGQPVTLSDLTGRVVVLSFWETWSSQCREQLPHLADIHGEFGGQPAFKLLAVSCGRTAKEDLGTFRDGTEALLQQQNLKLPIYTDPGGVSHSAVDQVVGFNQIPTTLILDRQGRIRGVWAGFRPGFVRAMRQLVAQLLAEE